jgi:hypothetical protein
MPVPAGGRGGQDVREDMGMSETGTVQQAYTAILQHLVDTGRAPTTPSWPSCWA